MGSEMIYENFQILHTLYTKKYVIFCSKPCKKLGQPNMFKFYIKLFLHGTSLA